MFSALKFVLFNLFYTIIPLTDVIFDIKTFNYQVIFTCMQKIIWHYSQTCVQRPLLGPGKSCRLTEVPDKTEI